MVYTRMEKKEANPVREDKTIKSENNLLEWLSRHGGPLLRNTFAETIIHSNDYPAIRLTIRCRDGILPTADTIFKQDENLLGTDTCCHCSLQYNTNVAENARHACLFCPSHIGRNNHSVERII